MLLIDVLTPRLTGHRKLRYFNQSYVKPCRTRVKSFKHSDFFFFTEFDYGSQTTFGTWIKLFMETRILCFLFCVESAYNALPG